MAHTKILVAGDSYAEFPRFEYNYSNSNEEFIDRSNAVVNIDGESFSRDFKHWCELLADHANGTAHSVGLPGRNLNVTSFEAQRHLLSGSYTHMVFFVTCFLRDNYYPGNDDLMTKMSALSDCQHNATLSDYYTIDNINHNIVQKYNYMHPENDTIVPDLDVFARNKTHLEYIHDRLSNIAMLYATCKAQGVTPMFVIPWGQEIVEDYLVNVLKDPCFFYYGFTAMDDTNFHKYNAIPSHVFKQEHVAGLKLFLKQHPDFIQTGK